MTRLRFETFASGGRLPALPFTVRVRDHGTEVHVTKQQTMLAALRGAGIDMMWDCLRGECGLCTVDVCDGEDRLDHRDVFLSAQAHARPASCARAFHAPPAGRSPSTPASAPSHLRPARDDPDAPGRPERVGSTSKAVTPRRQVRATSSKS